MEIVGSGSLSNFTKEDFYTEIRTIREQMGNVETFNPDLLIEKAGLLYLCCEDEEIRNTCQYLIEEIERRAEFINRF